MKRFISIFMALLTITAMLTISGYSALAGDVNNDGTVTNVDAMLALDIASGKRKGTSAEIKAADYDKDGVVTTEDVILIIKNAEDAYANSLLKAGFPLSYIESLEELHKKYPKWEFKPFITKLNWADAVEGERTMPVSSGRSQYHKKQLIENNVTSIWECQCSSCKGKIQEGSTWVSASKEAVEYYLDPRNFLTEKHIFQFESTHYDSAQSQSAVEAILKPTWMYNSEISYLDATGAQKTYKIDGKAVKYSEAIMKAAKDSGMSAYYLASKIVQEVGSTSASNVSTASGKKAPYNGIYNYYNIGAYTGAVDGLKWANGYMKTKASTKLYKSAKTSAEVLVEVPSGKELNYIDISGSFYKVAYTVSSKKYTGFIPKTSVSISTTYGRPWSDPYKSIYYGAQYIYEGYSEYQYTGYLQKFNVNSASGNLYGHEYMANIRAAASESEKTYKAYNENNILADSMIFYIPVFKNMPNGNSTKIDGFKATKQSLISSLTEKTSAVLDWSKVNGASGYQLYKYDSVTKKYVKLLSTTSLTYTDTTLKSGETYSYKVRAYQKQADSTYIYTKYSDVLSVTAVKETTSTPTVTPSTGDTAYSAKGTVNISSGTLNIRSTPSTSGTVVCAASKGQEVTITAKNGEWYKVTLTVDGTKYSGYAHSDYIAIDKTESVAAKCPYTEPTATLRNGNSGEGVKWLQWHLWKLGYLVSDSDVDGHFGSGTEKAVKEFQTDAKLDVDGLVGSGTRNALKSRVS